MHFFLLHNYYPLILALILLCCLTHLIKELLACSVLLAGDTAGPI